MENVPNQILSISKAQNLNTEDQITYLNNQITTLKIENNQLKDQIHNQTQQIKNLNQKMFQLQKTFAQSQLNSEQDYSTYLKAEKDLKLDNERLKSENELLKNEKKIIQISCNQIKDQYLKLKKKQEEQEIHFEQLLKSADLKLSEVVEERDKLYHKLHSKDESNENQIKMNSIISDLKSQNENLFQKNDILKGKIEHIQKENEQLRSQLESAYSNNKNLLFSPLQNETSIQNLQATIENDNLRESALILSIEKAEKTIKSLESQNQDLKKEIESISKNSPSELANFQKQYHEIQNMNLSLNERISNMTLQVSSIRQENTRLKKRFQNSERAKLVEKENFENKLKEFELKIKEQFDIIDSLKKCQVRINEENDQLKIKNSDLIIANDQLTKEKNDATYRLDPDSAIKVQKILDKLNQLKYEFYHEDEGFFTYYTERQYRDIIITLKQQLEDSQRIKNLLLKERNEYRKNLNNHKIDDTI